MRILFLDDSRERHQVVANILDHQHTVLHAFTAEDAYLALRTGPAFDMVYLDHDLNLFKEFSSKHAGPYGPVETTGQDVAYWIVNKLPRNLWPKAVTVHSHNPVGGPAIAQILNRAGIPTTWEMFKA